jgi:hypothetical protein
MMFLLLALAGVLPVGIGAMLSRVYVGTAEECGSPYIGF